MYTTKVRNFLFQNCVQPILSRRNDSCDIKKLSSKRSNLINIHIRVCGLFVSSITGCIEFDSYKVSISSFGSVIRNRNMMKIFCTNKI